MSLTIKPDKLSHEHGLGYTPGSNVDPYTVVVIGDHPYMSNLALTANKRGSVFARGGTYRVTTTPGTAPTAGKKLMFVPGSGGGSLYLVTEDPGDGTYKHFGRVSADPDVVDEGGGTYTFNVEHDPNGETYTFS